MYTRKDVFEFFKSLFLLYKYRNIATLHGIAIEGAEVQCVILWRCSQNSQANRVSYSIEPHQLGVTTRGPGLDQVCSNSVIPGLGYSKCNFTFGLAKNATSPSQ